MTRLRPYLQLVRLPNVFTAMADIGLGALATASLPGRWPTFVLLLLASSCLYCGGMVWNDFFDVEQDRRERPNRPLPSGRVSRRRAARFGAALLAAGVLFAALAGWSKPEGGAATPPLLATLLVATILLYDGVLKPTWAGPVAMGTCRFLNVLLGLSVAPALAWPWAYHLALVVGLYIVGVTWFARTEARASSPAALAAAAAVMLLALALALPLPLTVPPGESSLLFPYLLVGLGFFVGHPAARAVARPAPANVQAAVKRSLMGLVLLDAVLATARAGAVGLVLLALLVPIVALRRQKWLYAT